VIPPRLVLATGNAEKRAEWARRLPGIELVPFDGPSPAEDADDYVGNAVFKARAAATALPALGDDVGLEVDALGGRPGLETRRWADSLGGWDAARTELARVAGSGATYACGLALAWPDGRVETALGRVRGTIVAARGDGPGLEPCFVPDGETRTLAELGESSPLHHRSLALRSLCGPP
jgi:XTP/dITP diphosphohydrolase